MDIVIVMCTFPADSDKAATIARILVEERLAACINLIPQIRSFYSWQGQVCDDPEQLAVIKTTAARFDDLRDRILALHPYDCPEVVALPVQRGHEDYLRWVADMTAAQ